MLALGHLFIINFAFSPFPAWIRNLEPLGADGKMKGIDIIIALVSWGLIWENLGEERIIKEKKKEPA